MDCVSGGYIKSMYRYVNILAAIFCLIAFLASPQLSASSELPIPIIMMESILFQEGSHHDEIPRNASASVNLSSNLKVDKSIDFGFKGVGMIGDLVWDDEIRDGIQNENMSVSGISGVKINLYKNCDGSWVLISNNTTIIGGKYLFEGLFDGEYRLEVEPITTSKDIDGNFSWNLTTPHNCSNLNNNCINSENNDSNDPNEIIIIDEDNPINMTIDFGYIKAD